METGAVKWGVCAASPLPFNEVLVHRNWIKAGCHASMDYLERHVKMKESLDSVLPQTKFIISLAFPYFTSVDYKPGKLIFSRYCLGEDYHKLIRKRLKPVVKVLKDSYPGDYRICVDSAPVAEKFWAVKSGVGIRGKNGLVYVPGYGSWVFLAEILTTATLPSRMITAPLTENLCDDCNECSKKCPGQAIAGNGTIDARRCRSYLTIENRESELSPEIVKSLGTRVYGCDICQEVCPANRIQKNPNYHSIFRAKEEILNLSKEDIVNMSEERFDEIFGRTSVKRIGLDQLRRNCRN